MRLIDADELIKEYGDFYTEEGTGEGIICAVKDLVDKIPTVEPERKTGRWEDKHAQLGTCSACGFRTYLWNYCPNCGSYNGGEE